MDKQTCEHIWSSARLTGASSVGFCMVCGASSKQFLNSIREKQRTSKLTGLVRWLTLSR